MNLARVRAAAMRRAHVARWRVLDTVAGVGRHTGPGSVALTFDDGPQPGSTDRLLDILAGLEVHATFFCVGQNALAHPDLTRRIEAEGHRVGSHSLTHPHPADMPLRALARDYRHGRDAVQDVLGHDTPLFRPPHGHLDAAQALLVRGQGLHPWLWTVDPQDWRADVSADLISSLVEERASSGSVVLMHDWVEQPVSPEATDRLATLAAVPVLVAGLRRRGLTFSRLA